MLQSSTPIFRIFDEAKAREFYLEFLGFKVDFEFRFEPGTPLYMGVSRDECVIHLSEHVGDCCPGASIRISVDDLESLHGELVAKQYKYYRPSIELMPWQSRDMKVIDPFRNTITFTESLDESESGSTDV
ncbi:MAG: glyoxalase superfamily protein [Planctomycetota bacterium]